MHTNYLQLECLGVVSSYYDLSRDNKIIYVATEFNVGVFKILTTKLLMSMLIRTKEKTFLSDDHFTNYNYTYYISVTY